VEDVVSELSEWKRGGIGTDEGFWCITYGKSAIINLYDAKSGVAGRWLVYTRRTGFGLVCVKPEDFPAGLDEEAAKRYAITLWRMS
jgi:hypothetical protein